MTVRTSVDEYFTRLYEQSTYNCLHFTRDVWLDLTGVDLSARLGSLMAGRSSRRAERSNLDFTRLAHAEDPCLVWFRRPRAAPHIGVYLRGSVLHITERGVQFVPLDVARLGYLGVRFYR